MENKHYMILRYIVELKSTKTFTATKNVLDEVVAENVVRGLVNENNKLRYVKNSGFVLYDLDNNIVRKYNPVLLHHPKQ